MEHGSGSREALFPSGDRVLRAVDLFDACLDDGGGAVGAGLEGVDKDRVVCQGFLGRENGIHLGVQSEQQF